MSKGTPRVVVRMIPALLALVDEAIQKRNDNSISPLRWTRSDFIVQAVVDKLNHDARGCGSPRRLKQAPGDDGFARQFWDNIAEMILDGPPAIVQEADIVEPVRDPVSFDPKTNPADLPLDTNFWRASED